MATIDYTWLFIQMLAALVVVCVGAVLLLKYGLPRLSFLQRRQKNSPFHLLGRFALEHRRTLYLMQVFDKVYLLGSTDGGIVKLDEIKGDESGHSGS